MTKEKTSPIIKDLYNGEIQIKFFPDSHQYWLIAEPKNKRLSGVTGITGQIDKSRALLKWSENLTREYLEDYEGSKLTPDIIEEAVAQHRQKKEEACTIGSLVHDWIEQYVKIKLENGPKPEYPTEEGAMNGILAFLKWESENHVEWLEVETMVYSRKHNYVGRFDAIARVNGVKYLIDFKTSKGLYAEQHLQTTGYIQAYKEEHGEELKGLLLHFDKTTGDFDAIDVMTDFDTFNSLVTLKNFLKEYAIKFPYKKK